MSHPKSYSDRLQARNVSMNRMYEDLSTVMKQLEAQAGYIQGQTHLMVGLKELIHGQSHQIEQLVNQEIGRNTVLWQYETAERLAQALNDYALSLLENHDPELSSTIRQSRLNYLPFLYSVWYYSRYIRDSVEFPCPDVLSQLSIDAETRYVTRSTWIDEHLSKALSKSLTIVPHTAIQLMMGCLNIRDYNTRNHHAHPMPTVEYAAKLFQDESLPLPATLRRLASELVEHAKVKPTTQSPYPNFSFQSTKRDPALDWSSLFGNHNCSGCDIDETPDEIYRRREAVHLQEWSMNQWR